MDFLWSLFVNFFGMAHNILVILKQFLLRYVNIILMLFQGIVKVRYAFIVHTFEKVAQLRGEDPEALSEQLWRNACAALRTDDSYN